MSLFRRVFTSLATVAALLAAPSALFASTSGAPVLSTLSAAQQIRGGYQPAQLQSAYDMTPLYQRGINGSGQNIAIIALDRYAASDIKQFDATNQLPDPAVKVYYPSGKKFKPPMQGETTMDLEWAHALAPGATIQIYYLTSTQVSSAGWKLMGKAVDMAVANGAGSISMSFGTCAPTNGSAATQQALARAMNKGVSIFVSSGDDGDRPGSIRQCGRSIGVGYPASDPSVVSVGGTSLTLDDQNTIYDETAWSLSGGGVAQGLLRPAWQVVTGQSLGQYRWAPDVAFLADDRTGAAIYYKGRWIAAGGTSLGAPSWAAVWALVRESAQQAGKTITAAPPLLYRIGNSTSYAQAFHDITEGSNGHYDAGPGWDAVTGWGTPDVNGLATVAQSLTSARK